MSKRKTAGERIAYGLDRFFEPELVAKIIDRAIRRAKAAAFDEGFTTGNNYAFDLKISDENPYRGRAKR